jgi:hypothetical protein
MPKLSLTDFVDVAVAAGMPKATKIKELKARGAYDPRTDFYKALREHLVDLHRRGKSKAELKSLLPSLTDTKKITNYPAALRGYTKWWGNRTMTWFTPPGGTFSSNGIDIGVNPELGLTIGGMRHVIKLYFKGEKLSKNRCAIIHELLEVELRSKAKPTDVIGVLDVRRGKFFPTSGVNPTAQAMLHAELAYIADIWNRLP